MRGFLRIFLLGILVLSAGGCDLIRTIAGRPTSDEIDLLRQASLPKVQSVETPVAQEPQDVVEDVAGELTQEAIEEASDEALVARQEVPAPVPAPLPEIKVHNWSSMILTDCRHKYYLLIGVFSRSENALAQARRATEKGYDAVLIEFNNSRTGVGICGNDDPDAIMVQAASAIDEAFCPKDAFILQTR